ncbi:hypothetical protein ACF1BQ_037125 [Bradyrhizobium sp. RDT10]
MSPQAASNATRTGLPSYERQQKQGIGGCGAPSSRHPTMSGLLGLTIPIYQGGAEYASIRQAKEVVSERELRLGGHSIVEPGRGDMT